ncbi:MAG: glycoside hydrolase family 28 protein, partial [Oscillospiraceae bacterium]|nr:glycoside hydrolase family 28 protein [Oscillospiraceae bacterium]
MRYRMKIEITKKGARYAVADISGADSFSSTLNSKAVDLKNTVNFIGQLSPDTEYVLRVASGSDEAEAVFRTEKEFVTLDVRKFGAKGDGVTDDTVFIQVAIMACPKNSRILLTKGKYKVTSLFMKSGVNLEIAKDAEIIADNERFNHPIFEGMIKSYDEQSEYNLGTWEGNPLKMFAGIITCLDAENVTIYGEGIINGNATHEDWWHNEKVMVGAFRPRLLFISRSKNVSVMGLTFKDSPSWTIHPYFSEDISLTALKINNPQNSPNTDGVEVESCKNVKI